MSACHTTPFQLSGVLIVASAGAAVDAAGLEPPRDATPAECCDYCASPRLEWRKCKLICADCRQINKSCADL